MSAIGIGIVGSGEMGRNVARPVIATDDAISISAVFDPDPESIIAARKDFGDQFVAVSSLQELLDNDKVDWVMIASWNKYHAEQTIAAFAAGKHVFCQKPLALSLDECLDMRKAWLASGKQFVIGFNLRYSPHYRKIKELLSNKAIGDIVSFEFNETLDFNHGGFIMGDWRRLRENAGSHLLEKCCHDVDLANWMIESRASRVASFGGLNFFLPENAEALERVGMAANGRQGYMTWRSGKSINPFTSDKNITDNQVTIIEYENGVRATLHMNSNTAIPERRMYICGTSGTLRADLISGVIELQQIGFEQVRIDHSMKGAGMHGGGDEFLAAELVATMVNGEQASATLDDGLAAAVTCFAIDDAMDTGSVVDLGPYWQQIDN
ncbi:MAG: Gfo/Idh/MocA family oxidoreductase [Pseudomonadales bacterium]